MEASGAGADIVMVLYGYSLNSCARCYNFSFSLFRVVCGPLLAR